ATLSSDSRWASPLATMTLRITKYSIINPSPISPFARIEAILSGHSWGKYRTIAISNTIPKKIRSVALADQFSKSASFWWASFFLRPEAERSFADLIKRNRRRIFVVLIETAETIFLAILLG